METTTNKEDLVSVIVVPTYEGATLGKTLSSLLEQTYQNLEVILVDTGKHEQLTIEMLQASEQYKHIQYIKIAETTSEVAAYNEGVQQATGRYIVFAKLEDTMDARRIEKQVTYLKKHTDTVMVCADMVGEKVLGGEAYTSYYQHHKIRVYDEDQTAHLIQSNFVLGNTLCFRKDIVSMIFPIPVTLEYEDWWIAFTGSMYGKIHYMDEVLVTHYMSEAETDERMGTKNFMNYRVAIARMNADYYSAMTEYCKVHKQHYLAIIQPMELRDKLISEYGLRKRLTYYCSEAAYRCRRKIRMKERIKIWAYVWFGPYLLIVRQ